MSGGNQALFFLVTTVLELVIWVFWLRLLLQVNMQLPLLDSELKEGALSLPQPSVFAGGFSGLSQSLSGRVGLYLRDDFLSPFLHHFKSN